MITYRKLEHTITGTIDGKPFNLPRTEAIEAIVKDYADNGVLEADFMTFVKECRSQEVAGSNEYLTYNPTTKEYFLRYKNVRSDKPIPQALVDFIEKSYDKDIDFMPMIKTWARLLTNPRYTLEMGKYFAEYVDTKFTDYTESDRLEAEEGFTSEASVELSTYNDIAITQEGLLATYKVAEEVTWEYEMVKNEYGNYTKERKDKYETIPAIVDKTTGKVLTPEKFATPPHKEDMLFTPAIWKNGDDFYSGKTLGYIYEIGKMQYLPKDAKRNLRNSSGGGGLYIGGLHYIDNFRNDERKVLTCFVNPGDILSFQGEGHAIRVDALFPNNVWDTDVPLKGIYHSSDYDSLSTDRLNTLIKEAVAEGVDIREEQLKTS